MERERCLTIGSIHPRFSSNLQPPPSPPPPPPPTPPPSFPPQLLFFFFRFNQPNYSPDFPSFLATPLCNPPQSSCSFLRNLCSHPRIILTPISKANQNTRANHGFACLKKVRLAVSTGLPFQHSICYLNVVEVVWE